MESTELSIIDLDESMLGDLSRLSQSAGWNQTPADWSMMLAMGHGWGIRDTVAGSTMIVASAMVLPYPSSQAWISMVLVLPAHRRRGLASRLMQQAMQALENRGLSAWLDATQAGQPVYERLGFAGFGRFSRWSGPAATPARTQPITPVDPGLAAPADGITMMGQDDLGAVAALDSHSFGADRLAMLTALRERTPWLAMCHRNGEGLTGFALGRDGTHALQIGPVVARDARTAQMLLRAAHEQTAMQTRFDTVYVDLPECFGLLARQLQALGFKPQRSFLRMMRPGGAGSHTGPPAIGDPLGDNDHNQGERIASAFVIAGPELG